MVLVDNGSSRERQEWISVSKFVALASGRFLCKVVIHTTGPRTGEGKEDEKKNRLK